MGKALIKGAIFGGVIVFVWMMISWMVLPWHCFGMHSFANEEAVASVIMEQTTEDGIYVLPSFCTQDMSMDAHADAMKKGPVVFASVRKYGFDVDSVGPYVVAFLIQLVGAFFITYVILQSAIAHYWGRVGLSALLGLIIGVLGIFPAWNWWGFSFGYVLVETCDLVIAWALAGFAIGAVARR